MVLFYELYSNRDRNHSTGNVIAVLRREGKGAICLAPSTWQAFKEKDAPVYMNTLLLSFIHAYCYRIREKKARVIAPKLFEELRHYHDYLLVPKRVPIEHKGKRF